MKLEISYFKKKIAELKLKLLHQMILSFTVYSEQSDFKLPVHSWLLLRQLSIACENIGFSEMQTVFHFSENQLPNEFIVIPVTSSKGYVDMAAKLDRLALLLYDDSEYMDSQLSITRLSHLREAFTKHEFSTLEYPIAVTWINLKQLRKHIESYASKYGNRGGLPQFRPQLTTNNPEGEFEQSDNKIRKINGCAFCKEKVLRSQQLLDCGNFFVLVNFKPYGGLQKNAHFLILPTQHIEDWRLVNNDDAHKLIAIVQAIARSIQANCDVSHKDLVLFMQNGVNSGQTVPHAHMHLFAKPEPRRFFENVLQQFNNHPQKELTEKQIQKVSRRFAPVFFQELKSQQGKIPRPITSDDKYPLQITRPV